MATWDPGQYLTFANHRLRPALDLLVRVPQQAPGFVVDLGCGAGNVTKHLRARWPQARILGVDSSPEMLAAAAEALPDVAWEPADFATWTPPQPPDVIFANASLHWLDEQAVLFTRLMSLLAPGGVLAAQMPRNFEEPSHTLMGAVASEGPWKEKLSAIIRRAPVEPPKFYFDVLAPLSSAVDIWETRYFQVMQGENPVAEFTKGSWLKPLLDALSDPLRGNFEAEYRRRVLAAYPPRGDGSTLFPFKRLFVVAVKKA